MASVTTGSPWRFLLKPWRYDFEYARAWRELDFPLYGVSHPSPTVFRMGGKGRSGVIPRGPARHLPPGLWTKLIHLGVIAEGPDWQIRVDTSTPPTDAHPRMLQHACRHRAERSRYAKGAGAGKGRLEAVSYQLLVDEVPVGFDGFELDAVWVGAASTPKTTITVTVINTQADAIGLTLILDPTPYLLGQRRPVTKDSS